MDVPHQLQTLLQFLVTDASSVAHLSYILDHLSPSCLDPSAHLQKWVARVTSLMHSKDPAARWAAICIAFRMSFLSRLLLIDNAQSWAGIIVPFLSKHEPVPILRASMRYLILVLCVAQYNSEFQRGVAIPILPRVSSALLTIAEKHGDQDIKASSIQALAQLVPLYPSLHKALSQRLYGLCNQIFCGSANHAMASVLDATVNLYSVLHFLGGKVGGTHLWRDCLDEVLQFSWSAWLALRTTFPSSAKLSQKVVGNLRRPDGKLSNLVLHDDATTGNPLQTVTLSMNRLKYGVSAIGALLRAPVNRPVRLPIGHLTTLCLCLMESTPDDEGQTHFDACTRAAESTVVSQIWLQACRLLSYLAESTQGLLAPHSPRLIMTISSHLENNINQPQRLSFLRSAYHLLYSCPAVGAALGINRLLRATVLTLSPLYLHSARTGTNSDVAGQPRATKKRRKEYEADNMLTATKVTICDSIEECDTFIAALDVMAQCMLNAELNPSTRSLANRILLSILLSLSPIAPSSCSCDPSFHGRVIKKVRDICFESMQGMSYVMSKNTNLFLGSYLYENSTAHNKLYSRVDLLLHPRRPPFVQTLPPVESLSFSSADESGEETVTRQSLDLAFGSGENHSEQQNRPDLVSKSFPALDPQIIVDPPCEGVLHSVNSQPQPANNTTDNLGMETETPSVLSAPTPLHTTSHIPTRTPSSISEPAPAPSARVAPMLVDESENEEVPTINLDSDSDT